SQGGCHPRAAARRAGPAGRQDRLRRRRAEQGGVQARDSGRARGGLVHRQQRTQGGRAGDRRRHAEGAARHAGEGGDAAECRRPGREGPSLDVREGSGAAAGRGDEERRIVMSQFFIRRPIVAIVISIVIVIMGTFTLSRLSFEQYPFLAPPIIRVTATYPGASAVAVEQSVATPIEQEVNGVERMIYMQ